MIRLINYSLLQCFQPKEYQYYLTFLTYMQVRINKEWIGKNNLCEFLK